MRAVSIIFRREMVAYLRSPVGYIVAALFLLVDGILFQAEALGGTTQRLSADVLSGFFMYTSGITIVAAIALSIRLIAEERQTGTLVLLNTSPVRDVEIVIAKFLSAFVFLCGMILLSVYMPLLILVNGKISFAHLAIGYLGLVLLGGASLAIGMFSTAIARQQLIAAAVGATTAGVMYLLHPLATKLAPPLKNIVSNLGLWHIHYRDGFLRGIWNLSDTVYYLAVIYFFLLLATKILEAKRWR